jgi:hypothetical protein
MTILFGPAYPNYRETMPDPIKPHPLNVIGDYYVQDGCCMSCTVPQSEAPNLFGVTNEPYYHCYVKQQPTTPEESKRMLTANRRDRFPFSE